MPVHVFRGWGGPRALLQVPLHILLMLMWVHLCIFVRCMCTCAHRVFVHGSVFILCVYFRVHICLCACTLGSVYRGVCVYPMCLYVGIWLSHTCIQGTCIWMSLCV